MNGGGIGNPPSDGDWSSGSSGNFSEGDSTFGGSGVDLGKIQLCLRTRILFINGSGLSVGEVQYPLS